MADDTTHYSYVYDDESGNIEQMNASGAYFSGTITPTYDKFGRTDNKIIDFNVNGTDAFYSKLIYDYVTNADRESILVSQMTVQNGTSASNTVSKTYNYTYDNNGNITQITSASGVIQNKYYYDDLGQIVREDNRALNATYTYSYDNAGNITAKKRYSLSFGSLGSVLDSSEELINNQKALKQLAREIERNARYKNSFITYEDALIFDEWCNDYGIPQHQPAKIGSGSHWITG